MSSLAAELPAQIKRIWGIIEETYEAQSLLAKQGRNADEPRAYRRSLRASCDRAIDALASQDVAAMMSSYEDLKGYSA